MNGQINNHQTHESPPVTPHPQLPVVPESKARPRARNGKVARLSYLQRDMVNRMLRNNISYARIVDALDEHDIRVTERNVSNWQTRGGYKEWCIEQDRALEIRIQQDNLTDYLRTNDASQLPEVGLQLAATRLSQFLLTPEAEQQFAADQKTYSRTVAMLCRLTSQIDALQKYRDAAAKELGDEHNPERLKREAEDHTESTRHIYSAAKLAETNDGYDIPHRNLLPKP